MEALFYVSSLCLWAAGNSVSLAKATISSNPNLLAFSRSEERHRQIWIVAFGPEGGSSTQQLTRYGGEKPVWLPDDSAILYENNGQLWLISKDGLETHPVMVKGKRIFGHEPYAIPSSIP